MRAPAQAGMPSILFQRNLKFMTGAGAAGIQISGATDPDVVATLAAEPRGRRRRPHRSSHERPEGGRKLDRSEHDHKGQRLRSKSGGLVAGCAPTTNMRTGSRNFTSLWSTVFLLVSSSFTFAAMTGASGPQRKSAKLRKRRKEWDAYVEARDDRLGLGGRSVVS
jgi:hypothetical protein